MKTIYLKASNKEDIVSDIQKWLPVEQTKLGQIGYFGQTEYSSNGIHVHYIGDILINQPTFNSFGEIVTEPVFSGFYHANVLVPDDFDDTIFTTKIDQPNNPKHKFA